MFSLSPKQWLVDMLASSLGLPSTVPLFHDDNTSSFSLSSPTKIVLHNLQNSQCSIDTLEFSWEWSNSTTGDVSSPNIFFQSPVISVRGVRWIVLPRTANDDAHQSQASKQSLIDHLFAKIRVVGISSTLLQIHDLEIVLQGRDDDSELVCQIDHIRLESSSSLEVLSSEGSTQRVSLDGVSVFLRNGSNNGLLEHSVLLEPFSYSAWIHYYFAKRHTDDLRSNVVAEVIGDTTTNDDDIWILHTANLDALVPIMENLRATFHTNSTTTAQQGELTRCNSTEIESRATSFILPLPSMVLVLPNGTRIQLTKGKSSTVRYNTDGSTFQWIGCSSLVQVQKDEQITTPLLRFSKETSWCIDFVRCHWAIVKTTAEDELLFADALEEETASDDEDTLAVAWIYCDEAEMQRLIDGFLALERSTRRIIEQYKNHGTACATTAPWTFSLPGHLSMRFLGQQDERMDVTLDDVAFGFSAVTDQIFSWFSMKRCSLCCPTSFGDATMEIIDMHLAAGCDGFYINEPVFVKLQSVSVAEAVQKFLVRMLGQLQSFSPRHNLENARLPISVRALRVDLIVAEPTMTNVTMNNLQCGRDGTVFCGTVYWHHGENGGTSGSMKGLWFRHGTNVSIDRIESFRVPGLFELARPVLGAYLNFTGGRLDIELSPFCAVVEKDRFPTLTDGPCASFLDVTKPAETAAACDWSYPPFTAHITMSELYLQTQMDAATIFVFPIQAAIVNERENVLFQSCATMNFRFESPKDDWVGAGLTRLCSISPKSIQCTEFHVGPVSYGNVSLNVPSIYIESESIRVAGVVDVCIGSTDAVGYTQALLQQICQLFDNYREESFVATQRVTIPKIELDVVDVHTVATDVSVVDWSTVRCVNFQVSERTTNASISASGLITDLFQRTARVGSVDSLYVPGVCFLAEPAKNVSLSFSNDAVFGLDVPSASILLLGDSLGQNDTGGQASPPFAIRLSVSELNMKGTSMDSERTRVTGMIAEIMPDRGTRFDVRFDAVQKRMVHVLGARISGVIDNSETNTISDFLLEPGSVTISADLSSVEWSKMIGKKDQKEPVNSWRLPCGQIASFSAKVSLDGHVLFTQSLLRIPPFKGSPDSHSFDFVNHLTRVALREIPSFYNHALVLGESATDITAKAAGRMVGTTVAGSTLGSIGALVLADSVKGALILGRNARGASAEDKHQLSDFVFGIYRAMKTAAMNGGRLRRGNIGPYRYYVGDFSTGVCDALGRYISENKSRFGAAGGSVIGMTIGGLFYGAIGIIIGNYLGAKAGTRLLKDDQVPVANAASLQSLVPLKPCWESVDGDWVVLDIISPDSDKADFAVGWIDHSLSCKERDVSINTKGYNTAVSAEASPDISSSLDRENMNPCSSAVHLRLRPVTGFECSRGNDSLSKPLCSNAQLVDCVTSMPERGTYHPRRLLQTSRFAITRWSQRKRLDGQSS